LGSVPGNSLGTFTSSQPQDEVWTFDYEPGKFLPIFSDFMLLLSESVTLSSPQLRSLTVWLPFVLTGWEFAVFPRLSLPPRPNPFSFAIDL
jgi:hypothetical protein